MFGCVSIAGKVQYDQTFSIFYESESLKNQILFVVV